MTKIIKKHNKKDYQCKSNNKYVAKLETRVLGGFIGVVYNRLIGLVSRVFANGPGNLGSIPGRIIPKTLKMVLDTSLLNTQQYKVHIKDKVE